jgi:RNA recognition motif-containing protein
MSKKLYVGNIPFTASEDDLRQAFAPYNPASVAIIMDRETGRSRGFGFVEVEDALFNKAVDEMNGKALNGRNLMVNEARERAPRTGGGGYGGGGGGGGGRRDSW